MGLIRNLPGESPLDDFSGLKVKGVRTIGQLSVCEADNILEVTIKYIANRSASAKVTFDYAWSLKLHKEMLGKVWKWAGKIRTTPLTLGVAPNQIEARLFDLFRNLPSWKSDSLIIQAARLHHWAVQIHPFLNGNGRWSRMLANIWLVKNHHAPTIWPDAIGVESPLRAEYVAAVKAADHGDEEPLVALHAKFIEKLD